MFAWFQFITNLLRTDGFEPLWQAGSAWLPTTGYLHVAADAAICLALLVLPAMLVYFQWRRGDLAFTRLVWLVVGLTASLALVHVLTAISFWWPAQRLLGACKLAAAGLSWAVVVALVPALPRMLGLRSDEQMRRVDSQRRRAETALEEQESLHQSLLEALPLNVFQKDREGRFVRANQRCCQSLGRPLEQLVGATNHELFPEESADKYRADDERVMASGRTWETVEEQEQADGQKAYVHVLKAPVRDAQGTICGIQGMFWDVTTREQALEARRQSDARFRRLVESDLFGVMLAGLDGRVIEANNALLEIVGYGREELEQGRVRWDNITPPEYRHLDEHAIRELGLRRKCDPWEKEYQRRDGTRIPVIVGVTMVPGSVEECMCFVLDMSRQKQVEWELREAKESADAANRAKSQFLANMSHEIRTPMNAVIGLTELLRTTPLAPQQREYVSMVLEAAESLLAVIDEVLDFAKVEAGKLELRVAPFSLRDCLHAAVQLLAVKAHAKGLELATDFGPEVPEYVLGDAVRLRQVLVNLLSNAVKFTDAGEIIVRAQCLPASSADDAAEVSESGLPAGSDVTLQISVQDRGIGVPEDRLEAIFEAFEQVDGSMTRRHSGTGLGLTISSRLVQLMGGRMWVESQLGRGSTFHFSVRLARAPSPSPKRPLKLLPLPNVRVLVVDDNATNRRILHDMLEQFGMRSEGAEGGQVALERLHAARRDGQPYRLVLTDANMPDLHGLELAAAIQRDPEIHETPVMLLTSGDSWDWDTDFEGETASDAIRPVVAARLNKPLKQADLQSALRDVLQRDVLQAEPLPRGEASEPDGAAVPAPATGRKLRILVAEDSPINQELARSLLTGMGHLVDVAVNGREALEMLERQPFDLVLMDIQMPEMDGLSAAREIRRREQGTGRHLPIIAVTAHAMRGDRQRCLEAGMDEYLTKPIRAQTLRAGLALYTQIPSDVGAASIADAPPDLAATDQQPERGHPEPASEAAAAWNAEALRENFGGDRRLMHAVARTFLREAPGMLRTVRSACDARHAEDLRRAAHTIKGSVGYFSAQGALQAAEAMEQAGRAGDFEAGEAQWEVLRREVEALLLEIEQFVSTTQNPEP